MIENLSATNVIGIGVDIVSIKEFEATLERTPAFADRTFTPGELSVSRERSHPAATLAGLFAAKESLLKSFGSGLFEHCELRRIEIGHRPNGQPYFKNIPEELGRLVPQPKEALLSISHCDDFAVAAVTLLRLP